ncbi:MAG: peptidoglycan D,D-transpeptidase FtsI family protein [Massiliimalia sp.]|jgi:penicillin-binding protein 2
MSKTVKSSSRVRIIVLASTTLAIFAAASVRLMQFQIVEGEEYYQEAVTKTTSTYSVQASRGDIVDRYGRVLATSEVAFNVVFDWSFVDKQELNQTIYQLIKLFREENVAWVNELPIDYNGGNYAFQAGRDDDVDSMKKKIDVQLYATVDNCISQMKSRYGINDYPIEEKDGKYVFSEGQDKKVKELQKNLQDTLSVSSEETQTAEQCWELIQQNPDEFPVYSEQDAFDIMAVRYSMEKREFSYNNRYTFAENISEDMIINIKEHGYLFPGVDVAQETTRVYKNGDVASHLLGFVGPIYAEEYAELKADGYQLNDIVGKSGVESLMEKELRGENGTVRITQNAQGDVISTQTDVEAKAGNTVQLTIDYEFQKRVQEILTDFMVNGNYTKTPMPEGTKPGASVVALDCNTGEVLAAVSYPNYSIDQMKNDYSTLATDEAKPMYNRALYGTYAPGSSFKPVVGTAALMEGLETPTSLIDCTGTYRYWADRGDPDFLPKCLRDHHSGPINIMTALQWSCNIYFYDTGRRLGIDTIHEYATQMGLGVDTGIEIGSSKGQVASKELTEKLGGQWEEGDIVQAAIGQNNTMVTPISMACEAMTIANKGVRYETHIIKGVQDYQGNVLSTKEPVVANEGFTIDDSTYGAIKQGMILAGAKITGVNNVTDLPYEVAVKTGTPQTLSLSQTNNDFIAFTVNGDRSIALSCMIEGAGNGASGLIRAILEAYDECCELGEAETSPQYPQSLDDILS